jgi:xylose isomerase
MSLDSLEAKVHSGEIDPSPTSGHQELLENRVNEVIWSVEG